MKRMERRSRGVVWAILLFFYVPIIVLVVNSFNKDRYAGFAGVIQQYMFYYGKSKDYLLK